MLGGDGRLLGIFGNREEACTGFFSNDAILAWLLPVAFQSSVSSALLVQDFRPPLLPGSAWATGEGNSGFPASLRVVAVRIQFQWRY